MPLGAVLGYVCDACLGRVQLHRASPARMICPLGQVLSDRVEVDFVDLNCGCPIDIICARQAGSALLTKPRRFEEVVRAASGALDVPLIVKMRCAQGWAATAMLA